MIVKTWSLVRLQLYNEAGVCRIEEQLELATSSFLAQEVAATRDTVTLSKLFLWYAADFGATDAAVLRWVAGHGAAQLLDAAGLDLDTATLTHSDYNWAANQASE